MQRDISNFRKSYSKNIINEDSVPESHVNLFDNWFNDAISIKGDFEPIIINVLKIYKITINLILNFIKTI